MKNPPQNTFLFDGALTALQPLATCPPNLWQDKKKPAPVTTMPVVTDAGTVERRLYFPGSGLRGRLRRAAVELLIAETGGETPFGLDDYFFLSRGGIKAEGDEKRGADVIAAWNLRRRNPLVSLFGASTPWMAGRLQVGHAVAAEPIEPAVFTGVRRDLNDAETGLLDEGDIAAWRERAKATAARSKDKKAVDKKRAAMAKARYDGDDDAIAALKEEIEKLEAGISGVAVQMPLSGFEAIPQGTRLRHTFVLANVTAVELGLFLQTLGRFALSPFVGAHAATGCGMVAGSWSVRMNGAPAGTVTLKPYDPLAFSPASEPLLGGLEAWRVFASSLDADAFRALAASGSGDGDE